jgi:sugar O-acyltransferase (sialic acid O-acetyltransferase NeuD family)
MRVILIGAGGHARAVVEAIEAEDYRLVAYVDPKPCAWLSHITHIAEDDVSGEGDADAFAMGLGAVEPRGLARRMALYQRYAELGWRAPPLVHPSAIVSDSARLATGCIVLAGAIVQPGAEIGAAAIVNTGSIIEHDARVGDGAHIAPGAILLGGASVGACAMVGAGAVVLPGANIAAETLVPALQRYGS